MLTRSLLVALVVAPALQESPRIDDVKWLAGCWEFTRGGRHVVEQWSAPRVGR